MQPVDISQIPPETLQAVMQTLGITDPNELMQLIQENPQAAQQILNTIMGSGNGGDVGSDWVDGAAEDASASAGGSAESEPQPTAAGDDVESDAEGPPADTASASPAPIPDDEMAEGEAPMARGGSNPMDELISAQMMQRAAGDPNATVPRAGGKGKNPRMPLPVSGSSNQQQMIAELYRQMAAKQQQQPRR